ncbi:hypothetical protein SPAB_04024 [Salmonella enterica subsp. enterica serovar Paratyphi B str. SPB7]|uniref:Uncharacterized protein n=1 Tax=Salmonella paratyphi B (strain ATCC BAA-1250 / SPB7) TaxID=1016998 RepID=A0A6C6Z675_SALPB|nr:hypothetical protein SPAB_04024 [Salmonella enterica subsp. enterica serovar Paratyphi B str. SPB7]
MRHGVPATTGRWIALSPQQPRIHPIIMAYQQYSLFLPMQKKTANAEWH